MSFESETTVFIGDLPINADLGFIIELFKDYCPLQKEQVVIKKSRDKKYALVNFPSREIASRVIAELNYKAR